MLNAELRLIYHAVMPLVIGGSSPTRPTHLIGSVGKLTSITGTTTIYMQPVFKFFTKMRESHW